MLKYFYKGSHVKLHTTLMKIYIAIALSSIVTLYCGALYHFRKMKSVAEMAFSISELMMNKRTVFFRQTISTEEIRSQEFKREVAFLTQFLAISISWIVELTIYFLIQGLPAIRGPWLTTYSELARYLVFVQDPLINLYFMEELRKVAKSRLGCANTISPAN